MQILTLEIPDPEIADMIVGLAKKLNCNVISNSYSSQSNTEEIINIMKKVANRGTLSKSIPDPIQWQRDIRKDRPLPGREE